MAAGTAPSNPAVPSHETARRALATALDLFNRHGEPNVSASMIAQAMGISPGNLHYHYRSKALIVDDLVDQYVARMLDVLRRVDDLRRLDDAWAAFQAHFALVWEYRFVHRDLSELLTRSRTLERGMARILGEQQRIVGSIVRALVRAGRLDLLPDDAQRLSRTLVLSMTYWLELEFILDPRRERDRQEVARMIDRATAQTLGLVLPQLAPRAAQRLRELIAQSLAAPATATPGGGGG